VAITEELHEEIGTEFGLEKTTAAVRRDIVEGFATQHAEVRSGGHRSDCR
jgi:hypothetical protein